jgi:hypothetical protein
LVDKKASVAAKLAALPGIVGFYAWWYPTRWLGWGLWPRYGSFGRFAGHLRFIDRAARRLARASFHGMVMYRETMERRQMFLFRLVDVVMELFAMAASISRARGMADAGEAEAAKAGEVADLFCRTSRRRVDSLFRELWNNDDRLRYALAIRARTVIRSRFPIYPNSASPISNRSPCGAPCSAICCWRRPRR